MIGINTARSLTVKHGRVSRAQMLATLLARCLDDFTLAACRLDIENVADGVQRDDRSGEWAEIASLGLTSKGDLNA